MSASTQGIRKKLALIISLALLPLFLAAAVWLAHLDGMQRGASLELVRRASLAAAARNLQRTVAAAEADLRFLAGRPWVGRALVRGAAAGSDAEGDAASLVDRFLAGDADRLAFWLADAGGAVIFRAGRPGPEAARRAGERQCLAATRAQPAGSVYVSPVILEPSPLGGPPQASLCLALRLPDAQGRPGGVAALDLDAAHLLAGVWPPAEGDGPGRRLVLDQSGRVLFSGGEAGAVAGTPCSRMFHSGCDGLLRGGVLNLEMDGRTWGASARQVGLWPGRPPDLVLAELSPRPGWADEFMGPLAWKLAVGVLAASLAAGWLAWAAAGGLAASLRELVQVIARFGGGDRLARARESGPAEAARLAAAFNEMAESLARQQQGQARKLAAGDKKLAASGRDLRRSRALWDGVLGLVSEAVLVLDGEGRIRALNPAAEKLLGQGAGELLGREAAELEALAGDRGRVGECLAALGRAGGEASLTVRAGEGAGGVLRLAAKAVGEQEPAPLLVVIGGPGGGAESGEAASLDRQICRALFAGLPEACTLVFDRELRYTLAGGGLLGRMGFGRDEVVGKTLSEVFDPGTVWIVRALYQETLAGNEAVFDMPYGQGLQEVRLTPIRDARGRVSHGLALMRDLGPMGEAESAGPPAEAGLGRDEALRAPLEGVIGLAQALARGTCGGLNSQQLRCARQIIKSGRRLQSLLNQPGKDNP